MKISMMENAMSGLAHFIYLGLQQRLEPSRIARVGYALLASGCSTAATLPGQVVSSYLISTQQSDGGWTDVEETIWSMGYLAAFTHRYEAGLVKGRNWLSSMQLPCGAWGKSNRDQPRIPMTALASAVVPEAINASGLEWLTKQWEADLASPVQLTYKGAFFLVAQAHDQAPSADDLVNRTLEFLVAEQEKDGGFGPWLGHPAGSDPWSTGVALWGLSKHTDKVPADIIERGASWLQSNQLPDGLWPYHYLDDGSAMALIGISSVLPFLREQ